MNTTTTRTNALVNSLLRSRGLQATLLALTLTAPAAFAQGRAGGPPVRPPLNPLLAAIPGAANAPAPDWMKPGTRITFYSASASTVDNAGGDALVPDPNGDWVDDQGNHYTPGTVGGGTAGAGYTQIDVVSMRDGVAVLDLRFFLLTNFGSGPTKLSFFWSEVVNPAGCDWWVNPELLRQLQNTRAGGITIQKMSYRLNGKTYPTVYIHTRMGGGYVSYAYDLNTGVLLSHTSSARSARNDLLFNNNGWNQGTFTRGGGGNNIVINRFAGCRNLELPWANAEPPRWAAEANQYRYEGSMSTTMAYGPVCRLAVACDLRVKRRGSDWLEFEQTSRIIADPSLPTMPTTQVRVAATCQIGSLWIAPAALGNLRRGQVIDSDPVTGGRVYVESCGRGRVVITETAQIDHHSYTYDTASGMLVGVSKIDTYRETGTTITTEVSLTSRR